MRKEGVPGVILDELANALNSGLGSKYGYPKIMGSYDAFSLPVIKKIQSSI